MPIVLSPDANTLGSGSDSRVSDIGCAIDGRLRHVANNERSLAPGRARNCGSPPSPDVRSEAVTRIWAQIAGPLRLLDSRGGEAGGDPIDGGLDIVDASS
jgi:hypothetical protein